MSVANSVYFISSPESCSDRIQFSKQKECSADDAQSSVIRIGDCLIRSHTHSRNEIYLVLRRRWVYWGHEARLW